MRSFAKPLGGLTLMALGATAHAAGRTTTYEIMLRNETGQETHALTLSSGGAARELTMAGGVLTVTPPATEGEPSVIRLFSAGTAAAPRHTARHGAPPEGIVRVAYTVCGNALVYQSPTPAEVMSCADAAARAARY